MERMFKEITLGGVKLSNRFIFPPIKLAYGSPDGTVTDRQLTFYGQIAQNGPGEEIRKSVLKSEVIGDAREVRDIFSATQAGYQLALTY